MKGVKHGRRFSCVHILAGEEEPMGECQGSRRAVGMQRLASCQANGCHKASSTHDRQAMGPYNHGVQVETQSIPGYPPRQEENTMTTWLQQAFEKAAQLPADFRTNSRKIYWRTLSGLRRCGFRMRPLGLTLPPDHPPPRRVGHRSVPGLYRHWL
jgi:hypothetical protein